MTIKALAAHMRMIAENIGMPVSAHVQRVQYYDVTGHPAGRRMTVVVNVTGTYGPVVFVYTKGSDWEVVGYIHDPRHYRSLSQDYRAVVSDDEATTAVLSAWVYMSVKEEETEKA